MDRVIRKNFTEFKESENNLCETWFHNANGYIGVRGCVEEGVPGEWNSMRGMYINGFYDVIPMKQAENLCNFVDKKDTMLNVCDSMTIELIVDDERFDLNEGKIVEYTRELDMNDGVTRRHIIWESPSAKRVQIDVVRMASFKELSLFLIEYSVTAIDFAGKVSIISKHIADVVNYSNPNDPRLAAESIKNLTVESFDVKDGISIGVATTSSSNLRMCSLVYNECTSSLGNEVTADTTIPCGKVNTAVYRADADIAVGETVTLKKFTIITDSLREENVAKAATKRLVYVLSEGTDYYYEAQREYLRKFWKQSEMSIIGDDAINLSVAYNMYELLSSSARDDKCSIAAKGLSGEGYEGHYFWDTETFVLPFFILTNPKLARMILKYRYFTLDKAKENAKLLGHKKGALYPWRTIAGKECSGYFISGTAAYHINADIAYAIVSYYLTSGDLEFVADMGEEILIETARLWMDLGCYNRDGQFVINDVTGPDEYTCMVNNNYYTNCAASYNLKWAARLYRILAEQKGDKSVEDLGVTKEELIEMEKAADAMLLVYDEKLGINPQDDSFLDKPIWDLENTPKSDFPLLLHYHPLCLYRYQVCKQADTVMSYFMFEDRQPEDVMKRSFEYYEKITTHDSSLSTCVFSIVASRLGMQEKGYDYFGDSAKLDLENTHNNTKDGIHTANMGGCYMAIVNGFAGLRVNENGMSIAPFVPKKWAGYRFNVMYKGSLIRISVASNHVSAELLEGKPVIIGIYKKEYELKDVVSVSR